MIKSNLDDRNYRTITLDNKLEVLIINDNDSDISSASMAVNTGFYADPENTQGLAHFLEHMLFMGTKKHPKEDYYSTFIGRHGGYDNAYTHLEETVYYFNIQSEHFEHALDAFSRYFIDPLLSESSINREMNAVHSEHVKNINNDAWREMAIMSEICNNACPLSKFGTGNLETLSKDNIRDILINFYKKYYSSNIMKLVVYGPQSLDVLENYVRSMFSEVPNNEVEPVSYTKLPFNDCSNLTNDICQKMVNIVPIKNTNKLTISWQVPTTRKYYNICPLSYLSHLIGNEGPGSLYYELRKKGWCEYLLSHESHTDSKISMFSVEIELTKEGFKNRLIVMKLIYEYISLIQKEGITKDRYNELRDIEALKFKYRSKTDPIGYVQEISSNMLYYPTKDVLCVNRLLKEYDNEVEYVLNMYSKLLVPQNSVVIFSSKEYENMTTEKEKWYGIDYNLYSDVNMNEIDKTFIEEHKFNLFLPNKNNFIPKNLSIINTYINPYLSNNINNDTYPTMINNEPIELWYNLNTKFKRPLTYLSSNFHVPNVYKSVSNHEATLLFIRCLNDILNPLLYDASLVMTYGNISLSDGWLFLNVSGYSDNIKKVVKIFVNNIINFNIDENKFNIIKNKHIQDLTNYKFNAPYTHLSEIYKKNYSKKYIGSIEERLETTKLLTVDNIKNVITWLFKDTSVRCLVEGNITKDESMDIIKLFNLPNMSYKDYELKNDIEELKENSIKYQPVLNTKELNSVIMYSFDINHIKRGDTVNWNYYICYLKLLHQLISDPFFDQLRSKEQLGYYVTSRIDTKDNPEFSLYNYYFLIQSPKKDPKYLKERIDSFLKQFVDNLDKITDGEFKRHIRVAISNHTKKDNNLKEMFSRNKTTLFKNDKVFDFREIYVDTFKKLTLDGLKIFYNRYFLDKETSRSRVIGLFGNNHLDKL